MSDSLRGFFFLWFRFTAQWQCTRRLQLWSVCMWWLSGLCVFCSYRTVVRPSYKVVYRTVTSLEWKCCPGFSGAACEEGESRRKDSNAPLWGGQHQNLRQRNKFCQFSLSFSAATFLYLPLCFLLFYHSLSLQALLVNHCISLFRLLACICASQYTCASNALKQEWFPVVLHKAAPVF